MKLTLAILFTVYYLTAFSQQTDKLDLRSNSFKKDYLNSNPTLKYSYDSVNQTHNYSDNWDFDRDGIKDELYFNATGGAHLYYSLKVVLSTDHKPREFDFIQTDFPLLTAIDTLDFGKSPIGFVIANFGKNLTPTIIIRLDNQTFYDNKELKKRNINTKNALISFENGKTKYGCL
ncbi:MAG: hypothetical protein IPH88_05600 [Bacteroidales bacterium]|nr:hypothetical protein [Bacteroidales bacterium]